MSVSISPSGVTKALGDAISPPRARFFLVAGGALLSGVLVFSVWWFVQSGRANASEDARRELMSLSRALAEEADRSFRGAENLESGIVDSVRSMGVASESELASAAGTIDFHEMLRQKASDLLYVDALAIIDAHGNLIGASDRWPIPAVNYADREYFQTLARDPARRSVLSPPALGKLIKSWTTQLASRISGPNGEFLGVIIAVIEVSYFESAFSSFVMQGGRVSLFRDDGVLLARAPHVDAEYLKQFKSDPIFDGEATQSDGYFTNRADGVRPEHVIAFNRLPNFPLILTVSKSSAGMLAKWDGFAHAFYLATAAMLAMIATTVVLLVRSFDHQRQTAVAEHARVAAEVEISAQREVLKHAGRFEVALNNMRQGLCMFDTQDRLIVCNARYAHMYNLPENLTRPGAGWRDIVAHRLDRFGYRDLDLAALTAEHRAIDLTRTPATRTRELNDGRVILVRHQPIAEGGWVATHEDITERRRADERLSHMARHDALTGLPNRVLLLERLEQAVARLQHGEAFAVLFLDIDHFKETSDTLGHSVGDALLRDFALRLRLSVGPRDTVARIGGDEFAILRVGIAGPEEAGDLARRLVDNLGQPCEIAGHDINVGARIGIACAPGDGEVGAAVLRQAGIALYRLKTEGARGFRFFEAAMDSELQARRLLEIEFRKAVQDEAFEVYYQPLLDARTRRIRNFEALVRWRHPQRGMITPIEFIPLAEETGLIIPLGKWVLRTACMQAAQWPDDIRVSVNLSARQFEGANLVETVREALAAAGLTGRRLELEITESVLLAHSDRTLEILHELRGMDISIAMDDFGTGYSSLSYLRSFPFDKIKIDKSFVQNLDQHDAHAIVRSISSLGWTLAMTTTAEGVETEAQLTAVIETGCVEVQGYLFSKPVPAAEVASLLRKFPRIAHAA